MQRIVEVNPLADYKLDLRFADGTQGVVDLSHLAGRGVFSLWDDYERFRDVSIGETGELVWAGRIDLCPDSLYLKVTGKTPEEIFPVLRDEKAHA